MDTQDITNQYSFFKNYIETSIAAKQAILGSDELIATICEVSRTCVDVFKKGNKVILAGNGGSAADSQHIAAEFVSRFQFDRPGLPSISLSTDTSMITAIGNDYGFDKLFSRQLEANSKPADLFIGISTSGNSSNILEAIKLCKSLKVTSVVFTGESGGKLNGMADFICRVPSNNTAIIQESHIMIGHMLCGYVETSIFG